MVYKEFVGDNPNKKRENFRLRAYNVQHSIMLDTYSGREKETLEVLKIYPMKTLALEEKVDSEEFDEYDAESMTVKVNVWRPGLVSLNEETLRPSFLKVKKALTMEDFQRKIAETHSIQDHSNVVVLKKNPMLNNMR